MQFTLSSLTMLKCGQQAGKTVKHDGQNACSILSDFTLLSSNSVEIDFVFHRFNINKTSVI